MIERFIDGAAEVVVDEALSPIIISAWFGRPTMRVAADYHRWQDDLVTRTASRGERIVIIADTTGSDPPTAEVRRALAEHTPDPKIAIGTYAVIDNSFVRGALTAIGWLAGESFRVVSCRTVAEALTLAVAKLEAAGVRPPSSETIAEYRAPTRTRSAETG